MICAVLNRLERNYAPLRFMNLLKVFQHLQNIQDLSVFHVALKQMKCGQYVDDL